MLSGLVAETDAETQAKLKEVAELAHAQASTARRIKQAQVDETCSEGSNFRGELDAARP